MHEIDFLPVGRGKDSGDAIALRFTSHETGTWVYVVVDAGFDSDGEALVEHVKEHYGTAPIDLAILTHPDGDHIGGMGQVVRGLDVKRLWLHDIGAHGGSSLRAAAAVKDLIGVARDQGTLVEEPWAGSQAFGGALTVLGPGHDYYESLVQDQVSGTSSAKSIGATLAEAARGLFERFGDSLGIEVPFEAKHVSPRNNTSIITLLQIDGKNLLLTGDAGEPALEQAWDLAGAAGLAGELAFIQIPHHGSRRNGSSALLDRLLGPAGQSQSRNAFVSVVADSEKHPSGTIVNAYIRRGCEVVATAGSKQSHRHETPLRPGWSRSVPLQPMVEDDE